MTDAPEGPPRIVGASELDLLRQAFVMFVDRHAIRHAPPELRTVIRRAYQAVGTCVAIAKRSTASIGRRTGRSTRQWRNSNASNDPVAGADSLILSLRDDQEIQHTGAAGERACTRANARSATAIARSSVERSLTFGSPERCSASSRSISFARSRSYS